MIRNIEKQTMGLLGKYFFIGFVLCAHLLIFEQAVLGQDATFAGSVLDNDCHELRFTPTFNEVNTESCQTLKKECLEIRSLVESKLAGTKYEKRTPQSAGQYLATENCSHCHGAQGHMKTSRLKENYGQDAAICLMVSRIRMGYVDGDNAMPFWPKEQMSTTNLARVAYFVFSDDFQKKGDEK